MINPVTGIRINPEIKNQAQEIFQREGIDFSTAINIFLHEAINQGCIPIDFETKKDYVGLYLEPIRNERFEINTRLRSTSFLKKRLSKRRNYIYGK